MRQLVDKPLRLECRHKPSPEKEQMDHGQVRNALQTYRGASSKEQKREMERLIDSIKKDFEAEIGKNDKRFLRLNKVKGVLFSLTNQQQFLKWVTRKRRFGKDTWTN